MNLNTRDKKQICDIVLALELIFILVILILIVISLPTGFFVIKLTHLIQIKKENIVLVLIIMICLGLVINIAIYSIIGYLIFNIFSIILPPLLLLCADLILIRKQGFFSKQDEESQFTYRDHYKSPANKFFLILFALIFLYMMAHVSFMLFPNIGDAWSHGRTVTLIIYDGKIPSTYYPFDTLGINYPMGFHVIAAIVGETLNIESGIAMLALAGNLMVLIAILFSYIVYRETKSMVLSALVTYLFFQVHPSQNADTSVLLMFMNGTYPVLLGILIAVMGFVYLQEALSNKQHNLFLTIFIGIVFSVCLFFTYPSYILLILPLYGLYFLLSYVKSSQFGHLIKFLKTVKGIIGLLCICAIILIGIYMITIGPFSYYFN